MKYFMWVVLGLIGLVVLQKGLAKSQAPATIVMSPAPSSAPASSGPTVAQHPSWVQGLQAATGLVNAGVSAYDAYQSWNKA